MAATSRRTTSPMIVSAVLRTSRPSLSLIVRSSLAPDEQPGHRVIPHHAHERTRRSRKPPDRLLVVDRERHAYIGEKADAAHQIKQQQPTQNRKPLQPLVAVRQKVIEDEVARHGEKRSRRLRLGERNI